MNAFPADLGPARPVRPIRPRSGGRPRLATGQDVALALAVIVFEAFHWGTPLGPRTPVGDQALLVAFAAAEFLALVLRRRWPVPVFAAVWAVTVGAGVLAVCTGFTFTPYFGLLLALYTVARQADRPLALTALALTLAPVGASLWLTAETLRYPGDETALLVSDMAFYLPITIAAWSAGRWAKATVAAAERDQRELAEARQAVTTERMRIARELHDIVANTVAVIVMQADTARSTAPTEPARLTEALAGIEDLGRGAMAELRRLLRLLRCPDAPAPKTAGRSGLADLAPLLDDARRAGVLIGLDVTGTPTHLDDSVDLTAYRTVQEAVTNVIKHAGPGSHASVRISWSDVLTLDVVDDGAGRRPEVRRELSTGHGLLGLTERIALFGGELTATPYRSGFRVTATLPLSPTGDDPLLPGPRCEVRR
ncbi:sensor histidine kinase [Kitasatospora brasiliensis]|uniref:sensor histidine kinase n=1 Tax=Kitasatospora brasiliensis TaxID=3058040 RepID=UPI00292F032C|nr:sensor histidine kinase [Kitasatospora sp. K002]